MNPVLWIMLIAISPFVELRGAIPVGIALNINPILVFSVSVLVNIALIPVLFFILHFFFKGLFKLPVIGKRMYSILDRTHRRVGKYVDKYGPIGLTLFVAIPLPVTGAYTGCLVAHLLKMEKRKAMPSIALGVFIAGILVTLASLGVISFLDKFV